MKDTYSIAEAQAQLAKLVRDVESGVPVRIRRRDETVAYEYGSATSQAIEGRTITNYLGLLSARSTSSREGCAMPGYAACWNGYTEVFGGAAATTHESHMVSPGPGLGLGSRLVGSVSGHDRNHSFFTRA